MRKYRDSVSLDAAEMARFQLVLMLSEDILAFGSCIDAPSVGLLETVGLGLQQTSFFLVFIPFCYRNDGVSL